MAKLKGKEDYPFYFGASPDTLRLAGELRHSLTKAEQILWNNLRNRKIEGNRFRRQHPINDFIVDFFCYEALLVIEVDGEVHEDDSQKERDLERTKILNNFGLRVIRFSNQQIENNINQVVRKIKDELHRSSLK